MKKYVCLRDDDTNYFTDLSELENGYGRYWGKVPITLATVAFSHGSQRKILDVEMQDDKYKALRDWELSASAEELTEYHKLHPIGENTRLVNELKRLQNQGMIEIAQHGVSHRYNEFGAETKHTQVTFPMLRDAREYLSKIFEKKIVTYIPPSNTIDEQCAQYVHNMGMNLFSCGSISYDSIIKKTLARFKDPLSIIDKLKHPKYCPIRRRYGLLMITSFTYDNYKDQDAMWNLVKSSLQETGFAAIGTHYMLLNENGYHGQHKEYREKYLGLIDKIQTIDNVEFVTAKRYFELLKEKFYG